MKDFVEAFDNLLSRSQIKLLILKLEKEILLKKISAQKYSRYVLNDAVIKFIFLISLFDITDFLISMDYSQNSKIFSELTYLQIDI